MIHFTTKADTLRQLEGVLAHAEVLPQVSFSLKSYREQSGLPIQLLDKKGLSNRALIVRSSAQNEDTEQSSNAGKFLSIANVRGEQETAEAVARVIEAMGENPENQVFIQPYLEHVDWCGVAFTADPNSGGNTYVLNYDDSTGSTDSVTGGTGSALKTYYHFRGGEPSQEPIKQIILACEELERLFENRALDVEFAWAQGKLYILQVRPLVLKCQMASFEEQKRDVRKIQKKVSMAMRPQPNILGDKTIFGVMPDWNPAEMIGIRPRPLALSLYKEIITNGVWAYQRDNYGYRNLRSFPLMLDFCGLPYIDARVSFNSFLPKSLPEPLSQKLLNYYLDQLEKNPSKHDKIEFDIAFTCYTFDLQERVRILRQVGFSEEECSLLVDALRELTNKIIDNKNGLWRTDSQKINILKEKRETILHSDMDTLSRIYWLLEYCKRYGTLPFAGLARAGFVAAELLKSLVHIGVLTEQEKLVFQNSISTIGKNISMDYRRLSRESFMEKYGHLRPGTYDICSPRYDQSGDCYFDFNKQREWKGAAQQEFKLTLRQYSEIQELLDKNKMTVNVLDLFEFIKLSTEGREYSKFVFTQTLSDVLELLSQLGESYGYTRDDMSYLSIRHVLDAYTTAEDLHEILESSIRQGKEAYRHTKSLMLPPVIANVDQVTDFYLPDGEPNFITQKSCEADVVVLTDKSQDLAGRIVLIKSADPGYDWIFSHAIAGFITAYGGVNSHMAIRAAEFGMPAVVGAGEKLFETYSGAKRLLLDCMNRKVTIYHEKDLH